MRDKGELINLGAENGINPAVAVLVKFDNFHSRVAVLDRYCTNPDCNCRDVILGFFEVVDNEIKDVLFEIQIDVDTWEMINYQIFRRDIDGDEMIKEFLRELDDITKGKIKKRFEVGKKIGGEVLREDIDYSIFQKGNLVYYAEIFNSKEFDRFTFEYKGNSYAVLDQYCTNPQCNCNDVVLIFNELDTQENVYSFQFDVRLKFKSGKYEVENKIDNIKNKEVDDIYKCFIQNLNDSNFKLLKERYARMKKLNIILGQNFPEYSCRQNLISKKRDNISVGRNEPCPCGSGKKYKKCCGRS